MIRHRSLGSLTTLWNQWSSPVLIRSVHSISSGSLADPLPWLPQSTYEINMEWTKTNAFGPKITDKGWEDHVTPSRPASALSCPIVFVTNVRMTVHVSDMTDHMSSAGHVKSVVLLRRKGRNHVNAIVEYYDMDSAAKALETLHCTRLDGNMMWVKEFHRKKPQERLNSKFATRDQYKAPYEVEDDDEDDDYDNGRF